MSHRGSRFKYQLPLLRDYFRACHALISARDVCITAIQLYSVWPWAGPAGLAAAMEDAP